MPGLADLSLAPLCIYSQAAVGLRAVSCRIALYVLWLTNCLLGQWESQGQLSLIIQQASFGLFS